MLWPTAAERASLEFSYGQLGLAARYTAAILLFVAGAGLTWLWGLGSLVGIAGIVLIFCGHAFVWVKSQSTAPGGATPVHENTWGPVDDDWIARVTELERSGERWDTSPWDLSSGLGAATFILALIAIAVIGMFFVPERELFRFAVVSCALFVPLWFNGMRSNWNPSELKLKGESVEVARNAVKSQFGDRFDVVPLLAMREGEHGKYPVDARAMVRPPADATEGFIGVQIQVSMNSVQGTDYPYLYCVVLVKDDSGLGQTLAEIALRSTDLVYELGNGDGVDYLVVRQYADNSGGWHTEAHHIQTIVSEAMGVALEIV